jgi:hypothetical protein
MNVLCHADKVDSNFNTDSEVSLCNYQHLFKRRVGGGGENTQQQSQHKRGVTFQIAFFDDFVCFLKIIQPYFHHLLTSNRRTERDSLI